jgi:hypothetical protein
MKFSRAFNRPDLTMNRNLTMNRSDRSRRSMKACAIINTGKGIRKVAVRLPGERRMRKDVAKAGSSGLPSR